jgi:hypothetical protein
MNPSNPINPINPINQRDQIMTNEDVTLSSFKGRDEKNSTNEIP